MLLVLQVILSDQFKRCPDISDSFLQVIRNDLFPPSGQFIQIQMADGIDCLLGILPGALSVPECTNDHDRHHNTDADAHDQSISFSTGLHLLHLLLVCRRITDPARPDRCLSDAYRFLKVIVT